METRSLRRSFRWQGLSFRLVRARSTGFGGSGDFRLAECEHRALMTWGGQMQQAVWKRQQKMERRKGVEMSDG